jgi:excisionase family DNA binding protein
VSQHLTPDECGKRLSVSAEFIRGEIKDGRLPARKFERASGRTVYRIDVERFEEYVDRHWRSTVSDDRFP